MARCDLSRGVTDTRMDGPTDGPTDGQTLLLRCEDASKNGWGWLVGDLNWLGVILAEALLQVDYCMEATADIDRWMMAR